MKRPAIFFSILFALLTSAVSAQDYGFVHPGGLHTQADFDRVKAQLAAGNPTVKAAYAKLTSAAYSQSGVQTNPVETIVRGGGSGENYINAARGATMAYQNALRWKIAGTTANAKAAVRILMAWCNTTKYISGNSDQCLAVGLYGYQFAQAAELMRDYEGWSREDFAKFQQWMLTLWYPKAINFLRSRNGTWENNGKWWQAPGHYWSNWGLCNTLCVAMIGILCDDVFIYNQAMSYFKYDQCATFIDPRTEVPIKNDGLTEFLGNLVVTTSESELETGAYGKLGQMNESGRDTGHSAMALGLAIDIAKVGWNQGDDLFAYMDYRLAAGIEYVAAQTQSIQNLPWVNYHYASSGYYYSDSRSWLMEGPALGAQMRPYWGTVIGLYESVKGVRMPFSEVSYTNMGIDEGGQGGTSGGYDHLGYSVLMNTYDEQLCPEDKVPTELTPKMEYSGTLNTNLIPSLAQEKTRKLVNGKTLLHNELGGLVNTFTLNNNTAVPTGQTLTLMPQLPEGEEDTGQWQWESGETTRDITVTTDRSHIYRVTYTNKNGIKSSLCFPIAVAGDCCPDVLIPSISVAGGEASEVSRIDVLYGKSLTLSVAPSCGWGTFKWSTGATIQSITRTITADTQITVNFKNQGGAVTTQLFDIHMLAAEPYVSVSEGTPAATTDVISTAGTPITLGLTLPSAVKPGNVTWNTGAVGASLSIITPQTSAIYTASFNLRNVDYTFTFNVFVPNDEAAPMGEGRYLLRHVATDTYLTSQGKNQLVTFEPRDESNDKQLWYLDHTTATPPKYGLLSLADEQALKLNTSAKLSASTTSPFLMDQALDTDRINFHTGTTSRKYWDVDEEGTLLTGATTTLQAYPFQLIPVDGDGVEAIAPDYTGVGSKDADAVYDLSGRRVSQLLYNNLPVLSPTKIYVKGGKKVIVK